MKENELVIKTTEWIKCLWNDLQSRNFNKGQHDKMNDKEWVSKKSLIKELDLEIDYLENHVKTANKGIKLNKERVESWIFQTKAIKNKIQRGHF